MLGSNLTLFGAAMLAALLLGVAHAEAVVPLEAYVGKLKQVRVTIAGEERRFLFDTGGGYTLISPTIAQALGCTPSGRVAGFRMTGERFDTPLCRKVRLSIGSLPSQTETAGVFDLMALLPKDLPRLDGVISLASFQGRRIALDLTDGRLSIAVEPKGFRVSCRGATGLDGSGYVLFASVEQAGSEYWFEIDSGNADVVRLAPHVASSFGLDSKSQEAKQIDFSLGGAPAVPVEARVADILYDGVIGARFLEHGTLYADLGSRASCSWQPRVASSVKPQ